MHVLVGHNANEQDRLACNAFLAVFQQQQTRHGALLGWLETSLARARISDADERCMLESAIAMHR
jgi:hypothetical protein